MVHSKFHLIILNDFMKHENINQNFPREKSDDALDILRGLKVMNTNKIVIRGLNINSIPKRIRRIENDYSW